MSLWTPWLIGLAITIATCLIDFIFIELGIWKYVLTALGGIFVIGIPAGWIYGSTLADSLGNRFSDIIISAFACFILTLAYIWICQLINGYNFYDDFDYWVVSLPFIIIFIVAMIGWSFPAKNYCKNVEITTETVITSQEERELIFFANIPVQNVSGNISGSFAFGTGSISGDITTSDEIPYWYLNENGEGIYGSVDAKKSKIVFIEDGEMPYLQIISYCEQETTKNHNNGKESISINKEWKEYTFYLPEAIMYNIE